MEPASHQRGPIHSGRSPARRSLNANVLQDLIDLASQGVHIVTGHHRTLSTSPDWYKSSRHPSIASADGGRVPTGIDWIPDSNEGVNERQTNLDNDHGRAPSFSDGIRFNERLDPRYYPSNHTIRHSSTSAQQSAQFAQYQDSLDSSHAVHPINRSTYIDHPSISHSALSASTYGIGRHLPPESLQGSTGSSNTSSVRCLNCDKRETPEWRKGPYGPRTLCNACVSSIALLLVRPLISCYQHTGSCVGKDSEEKGERGFQHRETSASSNIEGASARLGRKEECTLPVEVTRPRARIQSRPFKAVTAAVDYRAGLRCQDGEALCTYIHISSGKPGITSPYDTIELGTFRSLQSYITTNGRIQNSHNMDSFRKVISRYSHRFPFHLLRHGL